MHQDVKANLLLEMYRILNFLLYETFIPLSSKVTFSKLSTSLADFFGLLCKMSQIGCIDRTRHEQEMSLWW